MDDQRFARLEVRVDEIKDDVAEIKAEQKINAYTMSELREYIKEQSETVKAHVSGDDKIIQEIGPIIEEFRYQQESRRRRIQKMKDLGLKLGLVATVVGIGAGLVKIFGL